MGAGGGSRPLSPWRGTSRKPVAEPASSCCCSNAVLVITEGQGSLCCWDLLLIKRSAGAISVMSHPGFGAPRPGREQSPGVLGPSLTHMMNHGTGSNVTSLLHNRNSIQNK
jgi:hypothetical protein